MTKTIQSSTPSTAGAGCPAVLPIDEQFAVAFADDIARLESYNKHHYRPNTYMHKWWARRCGSTFRLILKHLVDDDEQQDYYAPGGLEGRVILDPMMGGGTTLHEAIRMGANVVGVDIDPIPVLQARATLSDIPLVQLEEAFSHFMEALEETLAPLFLTRCPTCREEVPSRFTLYGSRRQCACGPAILVDSLILRYENGHPLIRLCARCHNIVQGEAPCDCRPVEPTPPLIEKRVHSCQQCKVAYLENTDLPFYARYTPLAVVGHCERDGLFFARPTVEDARRLAVADAQRTTMFAGTRDSFAVPFGPKSRDLISRGVHSYLELFSSRQLLYLHRTIELLPAFDPLIRLNLALLVSTSLEFNSLLCGYKGARRGERPGAIRHTFSYHAYSFPYTALENNMLYPQKASGTLEKLFHDRIRRARQWARHPRERNLGASKPRFFTLKKEREVGVEVTAAASLQEGDHRFLLHQGSAARLSLQDGSVDFIVTDPPYYDSVQYSDLAVFFRVWLQQLLPDAARWHYDPTLSAVDPNGNGSGQYTQVLSQIFSECQRVLHPEHGRLIFTFHNWKPKGWTALTLALQRADFYLINRYVVHSENPISVHIANLRALTHDAILVLAPGKPEKSRHWQLPAVIDKRESASFCDDCATLLGWLLQERLPETQVAAHWRRALA